MVMSLVIIKVRVRSSIRVMVIYYMFAIRSHCHRLYFNLGIPLLVLNKILDLLSSIAVINILKFLFRNLLP